MLSVSSKVTESTGPFCRLLLCLSQIWGSSPRLFPGTCNSPHSTQVNRWLLLRQLDSTYIFQKSVAMTLALLTFELQEVLATPLHDVIHNWLMMNLSILYWRHRRGDKTHPWDESVDYRQTTICSDCLGACMLNNPIFISPTLHQDWRWIIVCLPRCGIGLC